MVNNQQKFNGRLPGLPLNFFLIEMKRILFNRWVSAQVWISPGFSACIPLCSLR